MGSHLLKDGLRAAARARDGLEGAEHPWSKAGNPRFAALPETGWRYQSGNGKG